jgi:ABC-type polar amino acid transport system ATPase subunit
MVFQFHFLFEHLSALDNVADGLLAAYATLGDPEAAEKGRARAAGFTWERAAEATLEVYERAIVRHESQRA